VSGVPGSLVGDRSTSDRRPMARGGNGKKRRISRMVEPLRRFLDTEQAGSVLLLGATVLALVSANSFLQDRYFDLLDGVVTIGLGRFSISQDVLHWINDGLMTIFFLVVGLELKREFVIGELSDRKRAVLPVAAAAGGMLVPAAIYAALNAGTEGSSGWGIPMATDIAFAVGVLALVSPRASSGLKVFLLSLAIADDIGAIVVIAIFYSEGIGPEWLLAACVIIAAIGGLQRMRVAAFPVYALLGIALWVVVLKSGVHATIAGVILGLMTPVKPRNGVSYAESLESKLHPWSSYLIVPLFALANAGVVITADTLDAAASSTVTLGIVAGLVLGKLVGIALFTRLAIRMRWGDLPGDMTLSEVTGVAALAGLGFTVSLFISGLAFSDAGLIDEARIGILVASVLASVLGALLLRRSVPR
jgi:Na+:H+ antiporter, NhaA family